MKEHRKFAVDDRSGIEESSTRRPFVIWWSKAKCETKFTVTIDNWRYTWLYIQFLLTFLTAEQSLLMKIAGTCVVDLVTMNDLLIYIANRNGRANYIVQMRETYFHTLFRIYFSFKLFIWLHRPIIIVSLSIFFACVEYIFSQNISLSKYKNNGWTNNTVSIVFVLQEIYLTCAVLCFSLI